VRLLIARRWFTAKSTSGNLYVDELRQCDVLEDRVRRDPDPSTPENEAKVSGETAIPAGRYQFVLQMPQRVIWSPRPDGKLPLLLDVPGFNGIFLHALNAPKNTLGCIGVGTREPSKPDWIGGSRVALTALLPKLEEGLRAGDLWLDIEEFGAPPPEIDDEDDA
jgi:hypothetical protein